MHWYKVWYIVIQKLHILLLNREPFRVDDTHFVESIQLLFLILHFCIQSLKILELRHHLVYFFFLLGDSLPQLHNSITSICFCSSFSLLSLRLLLLFTNEWNRPFVSTKYLLIGLLDKLVESLIAFTNCGIAWNLVFLSIAHSFSISSVLFLTKSLYSFSIKVATTLSYTFLSLPRLQTHCLEGNRGFLYSGKYERISTCFLANSTISRCAVLEGEEFWQN